QYDRAQDLYSFMLSDLKSIADYLAAATIDPFYSNQLQKYDFLNGGSVSHWRKYCNSLRLRLAMRISYADERAVKSAAQEILAMGTAYPLVEAIDENIMIKVVVRLVFTGNDMLNGLGVNPFAVGSMLVLVMSPAMAPPLAVLFTTNKNGEY